MKNNAIIRKIHENLEVYKSAHNLLNKVSTLYQFVSDIAEDSDRINDFYIELKEGEKASAVLVETLNDYSLIKPNAEQYIRPVVNTINQLKAILDKPENSISRTNFEYRLKTLFTNYDHQLNVWVNGKRWNPSSDNAIDSLWCAVTEFLEDLGSDIFLNGEDPPEHDDLIEMMTFLVNYDSAKE